MLINYRTAKYIQCNVHESCLGLGTDMIANVSYPPHILTLQVAAKHDIHNFETGCETLFRQPTTVTVFGGCEMQCSKYTETQNSLTAGNRLQPDLTAAQLVKTEPKCHFHFLFPYCVFEYQYHIYTTAYQ
jgi:hypothetical protein